MQIFIKGWKTFYRQGSNLFFCVLFPSVLVFLLGNLLASLDYSEQAVGSIEVGYVIQEGGENFAGFLNAVKAKEMTITSYKDIESALQALQAGSLSAVMEYQSPEKSIILHQGKDDIKNKTLSLIAESYVSMEKTYEILHQAQMGQSEAGSIQMPAAEIETARNSYVEIRKLGVSRSMIDYYAVVMLVMIMFMGSLIGASTAFYEDRQQHTLARTMLASARSSKVFMATIAGLMPMVIIQIATVMLTSVLFYGAKYCPKWQDNVLLIVYFFVVSVALVAFGTLIGLICKKNPTVFIMPTLWVMMAFSGTFSKDLYVRGVTECMPMYHLQKAAFDLTVFGRREMVCRVIIWCLLCLAALLFTGSVLYGRKRG